MRRSDRGGGHLRGPELTGDRHVLDVQMLFDRLLEVKGSNGVGQRTEEDGLFTIAQGLDAVIEAVLGDRSPIDVELLDAAGVDPPREPWDGAVAHHHMAT